MGEPWPRGGARSLRPATPAPAPELALAAPDPAPAAAAALALYAQVLGAASLEAAAHRLVAALASGHGWARASIGLHEHGRTRLLASSHIDPAQPRAELPQRLLGAMDEAIDQAQSLAWPLADGAAPDRIRFEQAALQREVGGCVATVPIGLDGEVFGALCVERDEGAPPDAAELARLEQLLALAAPALRWMHQGTQPWHRRAAREALQAWQALRQPDRRTTRRLIAAAALLFAVLALAPLSREVGGKARVEGAEQRVLAAPADGFVKAAHVRAGDRVKAGEPLVDLLDADLQLERDRWNSQLAQHENAYAAAMAKADRAAASTSMARIGEAQAQLALVDEQLQRGRITAPFDGLVIQGDLSQAIGAPVRQGDTLLTLARSGRQRVIVEVDETEIARVQPGQSGQLAVSSLPWGHDGLVVERIRPLARAVEGRNVFEVEARLLDPRAELRPGLLGRAELVVGRLPPLWVWCGQALDRVRVAWWSWLGS